MNKVVRHYHGHLSAVQALAVHPTLDVLITTSRDSTARVSSFIFQISIILGVGYANQSTDPLFCWPHEYRG